MEAGRLHPMQPPNQPTRAIESRCGTCNRAQSGSEKNKAMYTRVTLELVEEDARLLRHHTLTCDVLIVQGKVKYKRV